MKKNVAKFTFSKIDALFKQFHEADFTKLSMQQKLRRVCEVLLEQIEKAADGLFLLIPTVDFIERLHQEKVIEQLHFNHFEMWLNQFSKLSPEENLKIRGKIAGRFVPREEYQTLFPIGMGQTYPGTHFVTAHNSPDLDTTVASFWGWVDAFAARVSRGLHVWNLPGGKAPAQVETQLLFFEVFGESVFDVLAKHRTSLAVSGIDLVTQEEVIYKLPKDSVFDIDLEHEAEAVVLVDEKGKYLGEWRSTDVDRVRTIVNLLNQCLRWYENILHVKLISLFADEKLSPEKLNRFFDEMYGMKIESCEPAKEFSRSQKEAVEGYLVKVLKVPKGLKSSFSQFAEALSKRELLQFKEFIQISQEVRSIFVKGEVTSNRTQLFRYLTEVISSFEKAIYATRQYVDQLTVALEVKSEVLSLPPHHVNYRADLEEIRSKMGHQPYLTVTTSDHHGTIFPMGVIHAAELFKTSLGTVTLRDFSNREETKVPPYLEVISILDHHKSQISTSAPLVAWIADAQSANTLVAQLSFKISDSYSTGGMTQKEIASQVEKIGKNLNAPSSKRILRKLLQRELVSEQKQTYFVSPEREMLEYLQCLYAILDDTDLLSKVSTTDLECVAELVNRLVSLSSREEKEEIHFDGLPRDKSWISKATARILQNEEMYSFYRKIYLAKEAAVEENIQLEAKGGPSNFFADTKQQNGCALVGQTKLFASNFQAFASHAKTVRKRWLSSSEQMHREHPEIDLYIHMISTIPGAEELHAGKNDGYPHQDEIWLWIPSTEMGIEHLKSFLNGLSNSPPVKNNPMSAELLGENGAELQQIFQESFGKISVKKSQEKMPIAVLSFKAGSLNSRKAAISPHLPTIL